MPSIANKVDGKDPSDNKTDGHCPMKKLMFATGVRWQDLSEKGTGPNCVRAMHLVLKKIIQPAEMCKGNFDAIQKAMQRKSAVEQIWTRHDNAVE